MIGKSKGANSVPFMENLFFITLVISNLLKARTFIFIHDLCAVNENGLSEKHFKESFPEKQESKK